MRHAKMGCKSILKAHLPTLDRLGRKRLPTVENRSRLAELHTALVAGKEAVGRHAQRWDPTLEETGSASTGAPFDCVDAAISS